MEKTKIEESRDKVREGLKKLGKDPDKLMPKDQKPLVPDASAESSPEAKKAAEDQKEKEQQSRALEAKKAEEEKAASDAKAAEEEKRLLEAKEEDLSEEDKTKKKELLILKKTEKEAQRDANIQKRIDELVGELKAEKAARIQDKEKISELESKLSNLKSTVERAPEKAQQEIKNLEASRIKKYEEEDQSLPRNERREMSRDELESWLAEDLVAAQEWIADRQLRRRDERANDIRKLNSEPDSESRNKAEIIVTKQQESKERVSKKHPELDVAKRIEELTQKGKTPKEIETIIFAENPKAKAVAEILRENPDKYLLAENGPELLAEEMERRMTHKSESVEEREARLREEGAEAERLRQANIDTGIHSTRHNGKTSEQEKDPIYLKQLAIFRKAFPRETEAQIKARLDKRLKSMRQVGSM